MAFISKGAQQRAAVMSWALERPGRAQDMKRRGGGRGVMVTSVFCYCTGLFVSQMTILTTLVLQLTQGIAN